MDELACALAEERTACLEIYLLLEGDEWSSSRQHQDSETRWGTDEPLSKWHGILADSKTGRVTSLELSNNNIHGTLGSIIPALQKLACLESLWLSENPGLTGDLPSAILSLPLLKILDVGSCGFSGYFDQAAFSEKLSYFDASHNVLSPFARTKATGDCKSAALISPISTLLLLGGKSKMSNGLLLLSSVHQQSLLAPSVCSTIIDEAEIFGRWQSNRHKQHATNDIDVSEVPTLLMILNPILSSVIIPQLALLFHVPATSLFVEDMFVVKYEQASQSLLREHIDDSDLSFIVTLNPASEFSGGGTEFCTSPRNVLIAPGESGTCVSFCGKNMHSGKEVTSGVRYILAGFVKTTDNFFKALVTRLPSLKRELRKSCTLHCAPALALAAVQRKKIKIMKSDNITLERVAAKVQQVEKT